MVCPVRAEGMALYAAANRSGTARVSGWMPAVETDGGGSICRAVSVGSQAVAPNSVGMSVKVQRVCEEFGESEASPFREAEQFQQSLHCMGGKLKVMSTQQSAATHLVPHLTPIGILYSSGLLSIGAMIERTSQPLIVVRFVYHGETRKRYRTKVPIGNGDPVPYDTCPGGLQPENTRCHQLEKPSRYITIPYMVPRLSWYYHPHSEIVSPADEYWLCELVRREVFLTSMRPRSCRQGKAIARPNTLSPRPTTGGLTFAVALPVPLLPSIYFNPI